ncbi:hypothetical protein ACSSV6_004149 [Roseovarius sp. MBR-38]|jgi:hypothetical protein
MWDGGLLPWQAKRAYRQAVDVAPPVGLLR